ncbi:MAG: hypothetical protein NVSMB6_29440 [Burkholderiaceae bacterium]
MIRWKGIYCDQPDRVAAVWEEALAADQPVVLEFKTSPDVPLLPSHISFEEAKHFATTIFKGDLDEKGMVAGALRQVLTKILPADEE